MSTTPYHKLPRRRLVGRLGVSKDVTGAGAKYDAKSHNLVTLCEFVPVRGDRGRFAGSDRQYRNVPVEGIESIRIGGKAFQVV
jgi:hypothetical protein